MKKVVWTDSMYTYQLKALNLFSSGANHLQSNFHHPVMGVNGQEKYLVNRIPVGDLWAPCFKTKESILLK